MFLEWLLEQVYRTDEVGKLASLVYDDTNNGCMNYARSASDIQKHFTVSHPKAYSRLSSMLETAFAEYATSLSPK